MSIHFLGSHPALGQDLTEGSRECSFDYFAEAH